MTYLSWLIIVKISISTIFVVIPYAVIPVDRLQEMLKPSESEHPSPFLFRLYAVAIASLLIGYAAGIPVAQKGVFPYGIVTMGAVSNCGASITMFRFRDKATLLFNCGIVVFGVIGVLLVAAICSPSFFLSTP